MVATSNGLTATSPHHRTRSEHANDPGLLRGFVEAEGHSVGQARWQDRIAQGCGEGSGPSAREKNPSTNGETKAPTLLL